MNEELKQFGTGLLPQEPSAKDFSAAMVLGTAPLEELPEEFFVGEVLGIKNQGRLDFCGGYATAAVGEDHELIPLDGRFSFMVGKRLLGGEEWRKWGITLRDVCLGAVKVGMLPEEYAPWPASEPLERDFLANPANWPADLDMLAAEHRQASFFAADGPYGMFDNIRAHIYRNRSKACSVITGVLWRREWTTAEGGVIEDKEYSKQGEGHAIKIFGWMPIKGETHLVIQNSWGSDNGDRGIFYLPRALVEREFVYGAYLFYDMSKEEAQYHHENRLNIADNPFIKLLKVFWHALIELLTFKK